MKDNCFHRFLDTDTNKTTCVRCSRDAYISFDVDLNTEIQHLKHECERQSNRATKWHLDCVEHYETNQKLEVKLKIAIDALKSICDNRCAIGINPCEAQEALTEIEKVK